MFSVGHGAELMDHNNVLIACSIAAKETSFYCCFGRAIVEELTFECTV